MTSAYILTLRCGTRQLRKFRTQASDGLASSTPFNGSAECDLGPVCTPRGAGPA